MIRTIIFYLGTIFSLFGSLFIGPFWIKYLSLKGKEEEKNEFIHRITHWWASFVMKRSGANINVKGIENVPKDETVLFVANHQSYLDIPLLMSEIDVPKGFIAKKELETWPAVSYWMKKIRCIFMDRDNVRKSAESIVQGINVLKSGYSMVIFPEGTRSQGKKHREFKAGSFKLATKSKVKIVPVTIDGSFKVLSGAMYSVKKCDINLIIHPAIDVKNLTSEQLSTLASDVEKIIVADLPEPINN